MFWFVPFKKKIAQKSFVKCESCDFKADFHYDLYLETHQ